jgi:hypothetical protein
MFPVFTNLPLRKIQMLKAVISITAIFQPSPVHRHRTLFRELSGIPILCKCLMSLERFSQINLAAIWLLG